LPKFYRELCEVCHEPIINVGELPPELQDEVYRPGENEQYNIEVEFEKGEDEIPSPVDLDFSELTDES
jgi:hypothetical protein